MTPIIVSRYFQFLVFLELPSVDMGHVIHSACVVMNIFTKIIHESPPCVIATLMNSLNPDSISVASHPYLCLGVTRGFDIERDTWTRMRAPASLRLRTYSNQHREIDSLRTYLSLI